MEIARWSAPAPVSLHPIRAGGGGAKGLADRQKRQISNCPWTDTSSTSQTRLSSFLIQNMMPSTTLMESRMSKLTQHYKYQWVHELKEKLSQAFYENRWMENGFRNLTAKVWANLDNPIKNYDFFFGLISCMLPSQVAQVAGSILFMYSCIYLFTYLFIHFAGV